MNTKELVSDGIKKSLAKFNEAFINSLREQLSSIEDRLEVVEASALNINELAGTEVQNNIMK